MQFVCPSTKIRKYIILQTTKYIPELPRRPILQVLFFLLQQGSITINVIYRKFDVVSVNHREELPTEAE